MDKKTVTMPGKYKFTEDEKKEIAGVLARKNMVEDEKKSVMSSYKDRIDRFEMDINKLSRNIIDGYEIRDFECRVEKNYDAHIKEYFCIHSGELIDTRPLDPSDYQQRLPI